MNFEERVDILNQIALIDNVYIYYIAIYKPNAAILRKLPHNLAYNYFSGMLIDRIVSDFNEDIKVVFDQRSTAIKSQNSLLEYITIRAATNPNFNAQFLLLKKIRVVVSVSSLQTLLRVLSEASIDTVATPPWSPLLNQKL